MLAAASIVPVTVPGLMAKLPRMLLDPSQPLFLQWRHMPRIANRLARFLRYADPARLDGAIKEMIDTPKAVIFDCLVDQKENCFPMIPSGKAHNEMIMAELEDDAGIELENVIDEKGKMLV